MYPRSYYLHLTRTEPFWSDFRRHFPAIHQSSTGLVETFLSNSAQFEISKSDTRDETKERETGLDTHESYCTAVSVRVNETMTNARGFNYRLTRLDNILTEFYSFNFLNLKTKTYGELGFRGKRIEDRFQPLALATDCGPWRVTESYTIIRRFLFELVG